MKLKPLLTYIPLILLMSACGGAGPTPTPTQPAPRGQVEIQSPAEGTVIYAESMVVSGTAADLPPDGFHLRVVTAAEETLAETTIVPVDGRWQVEFPHGYSGDPTEVIIYALPVDSTAAGDYEAISVMISSAEFRPEGTFGTLLLPADGSTIGGDTIEIIGTASGVFEGTVQLVLETDEAIISEITLTLNNPSIIDEVPFTAELSIGAYDGPARIRLYVISAQDGSEITLDSVDVLIGEAAG